MKDVIGLLCPECGRGLPMLEVVITEESVTILAFCIRCDTKVQWDHKLNQNQKLIEANHDVEDAQFLKDVGIS